MNYAALILIWVLSFIFLSGQAQTVLENFSWQDEPDIDSLVAEIKDTDAAKILDERVAEFVYTEEGNLVEHFLLHYMIFVDSEKAIDEHNKVYLNIGSDEVLLDYNARVIRKDGSITILGENALKEGSTEEGATYNYFAIEGAEKGCVIEYYYILQRYPQVSGTYFTFQGDYPTKYVKFTISSPANLHFATNSMNGFEEMVADTSFSERNVLEGSMQNVPRLPQEEFANSSAHAAGLMYHLHSNTYTGNNNIYNYGDLSQNIFKRLNPELSRKNEKELEKILKEAQIKIALDDRDKIFKIENYVKLNFAIVEVNNPNLEQLDFILENKACNETGAAILLYQLYNMAEIPVEIVLTSNRYELKFDPEFESYAYMDNFLLYFPEIDDYLMPSGVIYRLGLIPPGFINNHGLFIKTFSIGDLKSGVGEVHFIEPYDADHSLNKLIIQVEFNENLSGVEVDMTEELSGYYASTYQPYFTYMDSEEEKNKLREAIAKSINENIEINEVKTSNEGVDLLMRKPFKVECNFESSSFNEQAGDKVLFKIGQLIGPQAELYQEEERKLPVENDFNRKYYREISFTIPEGYSCKNLEDLNLVIQPFLDGKDGAGFVSTYELDGNKVTVKVDEYYPQIEFPLEQYPQYRKVINAAADFNKITLVLEKS